MNESTKPPGILPPRPSLFKRAKWWSMALAVGPLIGKTVRQTYAIIRDLDRQAGEKNE